MDVMDFLFVNGGNPVKPPPNEETKTDVSGYYKTPTGAVVSRDNESLKAYKAQKAKAAELNNMKKDIDSLKNDMSEIKNLLKQLVHVKE